MFAYQCTVLAGKMFSNCDTHSLAAKIKLQYRQRLNLSLLWTAFGEIFKYSLYVGRKKSLVGIDYF
jgi:hypothetical protein